MRSPSLYRKILIFFSDFPSGFDSTLREVYTSSGVVFYDFSGLSFFIIVLIFWRIASRS